MSQMRLSIFEWLGFEALPIQSEWNLVHKTVTQTPSDKVERVWIEELILIQLSAQSLIETNATFLITRSLKRLTIQIQIGIRIRIRIGKVHPHQSDSIPMPSKDFLFRAFLISVMLRLSVRPLRAFFWEFHFPDFLPINYFLLSVIGAS